MIALQEQEDKRKTKKSKKSSSGKRETFKVNKKILPKLRININLRSERTTSELLFSARKKV